MASRSKVKSNKTPHAVGTLSMTGFHEILVTAGCVAARSSKDQDKKQRRGGKKTTSNKRNRNDRKTRLVLVLEAKSYQSIGTKFVSECSVRKTRSLR